MYFMYEYYSHTDTRHTNNLSHIWKRIEGIEEKEEEIDKSKEMVIRLVN